MSLLSTLSYPLARRALFALDAETAHDLTLAALEQAQRVPFASLGYGGRAVRDPVTVAGLVFPNRVGLAAGLDKNARCIDAFADMGFGFVEVGTVTPLPQPGNPKPRMFRLEPHEALINRLGFNNEGLAAFVENVRRSRVRASTREGRVVLGLNIGKNAATPVERATDDYLTGLAGVYPHADYVTVNISSPNTENLRALQSDEALDRLLAALAARRAELAEAQGRRVPMFVKIAPDLDDAQVDAIAAALARHGMDGIVATNTTLSRAAVAGSPHGEEAGGLSGAPVREASLAVIRRLRAALGPAVPIVGVGGVMRAEDAIAKIDAGADLVQLYTGLIYRGPALVRQCAEALKRHPAAALKRHPA